MNPSLNVVTGYPEPHLESLNLRCVCLDNSEGLFKIVEQELGCMHGE